MEQRLVATRFCLWFCVCRLALQVWYLEMKCVIIHQDFVRPWLRPLDEIIIIIIITIFLFIITAFFLTLSHHFRSGTICFSVRCSTHLVVFISAHLFFLTNEPSPPFPHPSTRQLSPLFSSTRVDCLSWHSIKSLPLPSPPPAPHHRFPSVKHPQVHPPLLSPAVPP